MRIILAEARLRPLVPFEQALVVVRQELIESLLNSITPYSYIVAKKYRVRVDSVTVQFEGGAARVRLDGRASLADHPESEVFADIRLVTNLEVEQIDPARGVLRARLHVIDVEAKALGVLGLMAPGRRFVNDLAGQQLEQFRQFGADMELPVRLEQSVTLPQLGPEGGISIPAVQVPLRINISQVRALRGRLWISVGISTGVAGVAVVPAAAHAGEDSGKVVLSSLGQLASENSRLRAQLDSVVALDSVIQDAGRDSGDVQIGLRPGVVEGLVAEVARRYLARVSLDLKPDQLEVHETGELKTKLAFATLTAGTYDVRLHVGRIQATLAARYPDIRLVGGNRIHLSFPATLQDGHAAADLDFGWHPHSVVKVLCKEFETRQHLNGSILPGDYRIDGDFELGSSGKAIFAWPRFPQQKFRIRADLDAESWGRVRAALQSQNKLSRCGLLLDPDKLMGKLHGLGNRGFLIKMPQSLFRTVEFPASLSQSVAIGGRPIRLALKPCGLLITPQSLWYSAAIRARRTP